MKKINKPLVSVRLMVYNNEPYIKEAIEGVLMQKTNFVVEIVVGDDFSTDNTLNILKEYRNADNVIIKILNRNVGDSYWKDRKRFGRLHNYGDILKNCSGKYIAILDGDDYWTDPFKLQKQVDFLEQNKEYFFVSANSEVHISYKSVSSKLSGDLIINDFINGNKLGRHSAAFLFRNKNLNEFLDFLKQYPWPFGDLLLVFWCLKKGKGRILDDEMVYYRIHDQGIWSSTSDRQRCKNFILFYTLLFKSEINVDYDLSLYESSIDWLFDKIMKIEKPLRKNKLKLSFSFYLLKLKKVIEKLIGL